MSRFLVVVPPLTGHVTPTIEVGAELIARGHEVAWAGYSRVVDGLLPRGARVFPMTDDAPDALLRNVHEQWLRLRGTAELKFFWDEFLVPLGHAMVADVSAAIGAFEPDVVVSDQQALAGPVAAIRAGLPWVTSATTSSEITRPLAAMPKIEAWVFDRMSEFQRAHGLSDAVDLRWSPDLVLVFSSKALVGAHVEVEPNVVFTGPALAADRDTSEFPWDWLDPARHTVLASLGTLNAGAGARFFRALVEAVADQGERLQLVLVCPDGVVENPPDHVLIRDYVPQRSLLAHVDAVVTHGGHNTVCESLAKGVPLVVAPIRDDQPIIAQQVTDAGAGVRVSFARVRATDVAAALREVLHDPAYRAAALRIAESFVSSGGACAAADALEKLCGAGVSVAPQRGGRRG